MAKKRAHAKAPKYESFKLHGKHDLQVVFLYVVLDLVIAVVLGVILQGQVMQALASH
ncbi:MAG: hypothetical protein ABSD69_03085 [Candidatus Levyibacteriota bacterium]|jgi:hypothetical protein